MKKIIFLFMLLTISFLLKAQTYATTDNGKRVQLNSNGTWEYVSKNNDNNSFTYIYMGTERLKAGVAETVYSNGLNGSTSVQIAKRGNQKMIIFWQSQEIQKFFNLWKGTTLLYLENGDIIRLIDRNFEGQNEIKGGHTHYGVNGLSFKEDEYQRYAAYYLSESDCLKLNKSNISAISYTTGYSQSRSFIRISSNSGTCRTQLEAIE